MTLAMLYPRRFFHSSVILEHTLVLLRNRFQRECNVFNTKHKQQKKKEQTCNFCQRTYSQTVWIHIFANSWSLLDDFFFLFFYSPFFGFACIMQKFPGQEVNLHHHCDKAGSLIS